MLGFFLLCVLADPPVRHFSVHDGQVRLSAPDSWHVQLNEARGAGHVLVLQVPFPAGDGTPHASQVVLATNGNSGALGVEDYANWAMRDVFARPGSVIVGASLEEGSWLTLLLHSRESGTPYALVDRFGWEESRSAPANHGAAAEGRSAELVRACDLPVQWSARSVPG